MMTDKQKAEYLLKKLLIDIEYDNVNEWCRDIVCHKSIDWIRSEQCRDELERRIKRIHELQILTNTFEHLENILNRYQHQVEDDKNETQ